MDSLNFKEKKEKEKVPYGEQGAPRGSGRPVFARAKGEPHLSFQVLGPVHHHSDPGTKVSAAAARLASANYFICDWNAGTHHLTKRLIMEIPLCRPWALTGFGGTRNF